MNTFVAVLDTGETGPEGAFRFLGKISQNGSGVSGINDLLVVQNHLGADNSVDIGIGDIIIPISTYVVPCWNDAVYNLTLNANTSGSTVIAAIVAYVDPSAATPGSENNPGAMIFFEVDGSPGGSAPSDSDINSAVGSTYWKRLANITLVNNYTTITNAQILDKRMRFVTGNQSFIRPFTIAGDVTVANDLDFHSIVPQGVSSINRIDACVKTAPTGDDLVLRIYNITQAQQVGTVTIADGATSGFNTSPANPSVNTGDILRIDGMNIGSGAAGANAEIQASS